MAEFCEPCTQQCGNGETFHNTRRTDDLITAREIEMIRRAPQHFHDYCSLYTCIQYGVPAAAEAIVAYYRGTASEYFILNNRTFIPFSTSHKPDRELGYRRLVTVDAPYVVAVEAPDHSGFLFNASDTVNKLINTYVQCRW